MSHENSRDERRAKWKAGIPLTMAWMKYGDERQRTQQIERRGTPSAQVIEDLMMGDVFGMLATGELAARGFRTLPSPSDGPIPVPPDLFDQPLPPTWREDTVSASGETFERITICENEFAERGVSPTNEPTTPSGIEAAKDDPAIDKGGPRDTYPLSRNVLAALEADDPTFIQLSAERLLPIFQEKFREMHPEVSKRRPPIGARTLRDQLKSYRMERSGNNRQ